MAKQTITKLLDDLNGEEADETVSFALDGNLYSIDLSTSHASELRTAMAKFMDAAERVGRVGQGAQLTSYRQAQSRPSRPTRPSLAASLTAQRAQNAQIREWAGENGYHLAERGRIPQHVQDAWMNRHTANAQAEQLAMETGLDSHGDAIAVPAKKKAAKKVAPAAFAHA